MHDGGPVVKILDVKDHELGIGCQQGAIEKALGGGEAGTLCGGDAGVVQAVTTHSDSDSVGLLLRWANGGNELSIGHFAAQGDGVSGNEKDCVGAGGHASADALGQPAEVVG
jgi:hypothetical protein